MKVKLFPRYDLPKNGKRVDFCDKTSQSNVNNVFSIRGRKLHDSSFLKLLYGSIIAIIDNYKKSQKSKSYIFW